MQNDPCITNSTGTGDTPNGLTQELEVVGAVACIFCFGIMLVYAMWKNRRRESQMVAQALATAAELELAISQTPMQDAHLARARDEDCAICMLPLVPRDAADRAAQAQARTQASTCHGFWRRAGMLMGRCDWFLVSLDRLVIVTTRISIGPGGSR